MQTAIIKSRLPAGHKELSWIKGDGASWIETGRIFNNGSSITFYIDRASSTVASGQYIFGAATVNSAIPGLGFVFYSALSIRYFFDYNNYITHADRVPMKINLHQGYVTVDDTNTGGWTSKVNLTTVVTVPLLAQKDRDENIVQYNSNVALTEFVWEQDGVEVLHLIPDLYNNQIGMYDLVSQTFFPNAGTGSFIAGPEVKPIIPVAPAIKVSLGDDEYKIIPLSPTHKYLLPPNLTTIQGIKEYLANPLVSLAKKREVLVAREDNDWTFDMNITNPDTGTSYVMPCRILEVDNYTQLVDGVEKTFVGAKTQFAYALPDSLPIDGREQQRATGNFESGLYYYRCNNPSGGNVDFTQLTAGTDYTVGDSISTWESQHSGQYVFVHASSGASSWVRYGCNTYHESNVDKWLNGTGKNWFDPSHVGDVLDTAYNNKTGFKDRFNSSDLACIRDNVGYSVYERSGQELMYRQFTLLSGTEIAGSVNNYEGTVIEYWKWKNGGVIGNGANADRVMQKITAKTTNVTCWLRSPYRSNYADAWYVTASGNISTYNSAYVAYAIAPLFTI